MSPRVDEPPVLAAANVLVIWAVADWREVATLVRAARRLASLKMRTEDTRGGERGGEGKGEGGKGERERRAEDGRGG